MFDIRAYGRVATDIKVKKSKDGNSLYANFLLASHDYYKGHKTTDFIRCVAFGEFAVLMEKYFHKGDRIIVSGRLVSDNYGKQKSFKIKVDKFEFVETKKDGDSKNEK